MREMANLSGLSYRQLDHWARSGAFRPQVYGSAGRPHDYDPRDLLPARLLARVVKAFDGLMPTAIVKAVVDTSRAHPGCNGIEVPLAGGVELRINQLA